MKKTGHHHAGALVALLLLLSVSSYISVVVAAVDRAPPVFLRAPDHHQHQLLLENDNRRRELLAAVGAAAPSAGGYGSVCDGVRPGPERLKRCSEVEGCAWRPDAKECAPQACSAYSAQPGCDLSPTCHWVVASHQGGGQAEGSQGGCYGCSEVRSGEACRSEALRGACAWVQKGWYEGCHDCSEIQTEEVCNYINTGGSCYWAQGECKNFNLI